MLACGVPPRTSTVPFGTGSPPRHRYAEHLEFARERNSHEQRLDSSGARGVWVDRESDRMVLRAHSAIGSRIRQPSLACRTTLLSDGREGAMCNPGHRARSRLRHTDRKERHSMFKLIATMRRGSATGIPAAWISYETIEAARIGTAT